MWSFDSAGRLCFDGNPVPNNLETPILNLIIERNDLKRAQDKQIEYAKAQMTATEKQHDVEERLRDELYGNH